MHDNSRLNLSNNITTMMSYERIDEFEMAKLIKLPDFLISMELFEIVEESQIKNFKYQEISKKIKT